MLAHYVAFVYSYAGAGRACTWCNDERCTRRWRGVLKDFCGTATKRGWQTQLNLLILPSSIDSNCLFSVNAATPHSSEWQSSPTIKQLATSPYTMGVAVATVPELATLALIGLGLSGLALTRRRQKYLRWTRCAVTSLVIELGRIADGT